MEHWLRTAFGDGYSVSYLTTVLYLCQAGIYAVVDLNLPIAAIAALLVVTCLHLRTPTGTVREKLGRIDWM